MNDEHLDPNWDVSTKAKDLFERLESWPDREAIVDVIAYTLMPNHMHLLLREDREGGISKFMQRIGQGMTNHHNEKYKERGSIFQGSYKSRTIGNDRYLRYAMAYIMVKNVLELYPEGGLVGSKRNFDNAWQWGITFPFSSLGEYAGARNFPILCKDAAHGVFTSAGEFKTFASDVIQAGRWLRADFE